MRIVRLLGLLAAVLTAGFLVAPAAAAQPPFRLPGYVTDQAGALSPAQRSAVESAVDKLYNDRRIRLWVVYVDTFSGQNAVSWTRNTMSISDLGNFDALLAVATQDRAYAFEVPSSVGGITSQQVDDLRRNDIEPALHNSDWAGAALAAANGLDAAASGKGRGLAWSSLLIALAIVAVGVLALALWNRRRQNRRRAAELAAVRRADPADPAALASVSLDALDVLSKSMVVEVDNAVRTSSNELVLAVEEFGDRQTEPFTRAVDNAKATLAQAFNVRQQLDDAIPETPAQRRDLLTRVVVAAARADRELEAQTEAFHKLRDLVINAPSRLDILTQQLVDVTARISPSQDKLKALHTEFDDAALTSVAGNVVAAQERITFAEQNITRARELAARPIAGGQTELVDAVRAAESALGQARALLDAVDSAESDIRRAVATLPPTISDIQAAINQAGGLLAQGNVAHATELGAARDGAVKAVAAARGTGDTDPLGAFTQLTRAAADLDRQLAGLAQEREAAERLSRAFDQALFTAQSRVRSVSDYIDTRRGIVGPGARTRLSEATRQLEAAQVKRSTNLTEAIAHANGASTLAAQAQSMANADVQAAERTYGGRYGGGGSHLGAMVGGLIIGDLLGGAMGGGFGGGGSWGPTGFGGSSGGGYFGGGGRF
ncbi:MAG: TPM domain-containing protein [Mycobacteriaceae bacterium]|nr:TPM domain-containing protein [Mycobacteriaceae bacterium]MBV9641557.1 TPM domain-containing protein [Mycobacteriaceae bacterium]